MKFLVIAFLATFVPSLSLRIAHPLQHPLWVPFHHPSPVPIRWREDNSAHKDSAVLAGTLYLATLFSSGFLSHKALLLSSLTYLVITYFNVLLGSSFPLSSLSDHISAPTRCQPLLSDAHMKPSFLPDPDSHSC